MRCVAMVAERCCASVLVLAAATAVLTAGSARADVFNMGTGQTSLQFVTVGDPGNAGEQSRLASGDSTYYGAVPYTYQIGKYDVTIGQYVPVPQRRGENGHLRAIQSAQWQYSRVDATFYPTMAVVQSGSPGSYSYSINRRYAGQLQRGGELSDLLCHVGATRPASATGCKMASPPGPRGRARRKRGHTRWMARSQTTP